MQGSVVKRVSLAQRIGISIMQYTIRQAIADTVDACRRSGDWSPCTIRCTINDLLDAAEKDGYRVNYKYSQDRAVKAVRQRKL